MVINQIITNFQADSLNKQSHLEIPPGARREGHGSHVVSKACAFSRPLAPHNPYSSSCVNKEVVDSNENYNCVD